MTAKEVNIQHDMMPQGNSVIQAQAQTKAQSQAQTKAQSQAQKSKDLDMDYSKYDFRDSTEQYAYLSKKGLSRGTVEEISRMKSEPDWMREFRLRSYDVFMSKPMPNWGGNLSTIDFQNIYYY